MHTSEWKNIIGIKCVDEISTNSTQTEDKLLNSSRTSQETVNSYEKNTRKIYQKNYCQYKLILSSIVLSILGILQLIFPPYDVLLTLRIRMTPGLPPFEWWLDPPEAVVAKIYVFNVTNSDKFLQGIDKKIKLQEIGPIIYREKLRHSNVIFNSNSTLTYTANRTLIYLNERNIDCLLNKSITIPNIAVLFIPSYFYDSPFFVRFGVNLMIRKLNSDLFKTLTINEFLWNMTDPILEVSQQIAPSLVPVKNAGILAHVYNNFVDNVTVAIGPERPQSDFFKITRVNGDDGVRLRGGTCDERVNGSSEGITYAQRIQKSDYLMYYRKTFCGAAKLKFANTSVANSNPHFLNADPSLLDAVEGMTPDVSKHDSFVEIEPVTGIPLEGKAKSQLNLVVKDMSGFAEKLHKFSNLTIPLIWIEYHQEGIPMKIYVLLYFQVVILPILQKIMVGVFFVVAVILFGLFVARRRKSGKNLDNNKTLQFESEKFLKK